MNPPDIPGWKRVTTKEFYSTVATLDVHPMIVTSKYPYSCDWKLRDGTVVGKSVGYYPKGSALPSDQYYIKS